uniref:Ig-like domain-containing protein n=1 Tax=Pygocentrus nattereri TaxID=42514 RepID=A0AAR2K8A6_PYGNA
MLLFPKLAGLVLIVLINGETPDSTVGQTVGPDGPQPPPTVTSDPLDITVHETPDRVSISTVGQTVGPDGPQPPPTVTSDPLDTTVQAPCILTLQPPKVVVKYGDKASANCSTTTDHIGMGWEASQGPVDMKDDVQLITWSVDSLVEWGIKPFCFMNPNPDKQCKVHLNVTIYKTPESVSISTVNHTGPMIEGGQYELQCDIQNVAPAELLTVSWFKGDTLVNKETFANSIKTPVNRSATLQISPSRADDGAQYRCEAELDLGPEGPQPPPTVTSDPLNITVHYGPEIESGDESVEVYEGRDVTLPCTAEGNPEPEVKWSFNNQSKTTGGRQTTLTISGATPADGGEYTCTATNTFGSQTRRVFLVVKDDRPPLPLIISISLIILLIVIFIICIIICKKKKQSGKYDVQPNDKGLQMMLL